MSKEEILIDDYVRDKNGRIGKVFDITNEPSVDIGIGIMPEVNAVWIDKDKIDYLYQEGITNHSKDIIDLIEVGDYVNGYKVSEVCIDSSVVNNDKLKFGDKDLVLTFKSNHDTYYLYVEDIKSILTKEQFEQNCYKVEKEK